MNILVLNGPNLNMLGIREPDIYGKRTYADLEKYIYNVAEEFGAEIEIFQSNFEGELVTRIQQAYGKVDGIVINAAAYTHTSVAILDAIKAVAIPTIEVHLSDIQQRESFRRLSYVSMAAKQTICGMGFEGYREAIRLLCVKKRGCTETCL